MILKNGSTQNDWVIDAFKICADFMLHNRTHFYDCIYCFSSCLYHTWKYKRPNN